MDTGQWAEETFGQADLGDQRRTRRLVKLAAALGEHPSGVLTQALPQWAELKAAYRLLAADPLTHAAVLQPHTAQVRQALDQPGHYLVIEDGSELDFSAHPATAGLGRIGDDGGRGFLLHSALAYRIEGWDPDYTPRLGLLGLLGQQLWARQDQPKKGRESKAQRLARPRESDHWGQVLAESGGPGPGAHWTYVADRESDVYELLALRLPPGCDFVVRAGQDRALEGGGHLFAAAAAAPLLGQYELVVRQRPDRPARRARLAVRACPVRLRPPWRPPGQAALAPLEVWVVQAREVDAPPGVEPIAWVLLSSYACATLEEARPVLRLYGCRWQVEEYHKALKTGTRVEQSQLSTGERLQGLVGVLALVAVRLLGVKYLGRGASAAPLAPDLGASEVVAVLEARLGRPAGGWDNHTLIGALAHLGGFLGRKGDGEPGWLTIWRGWSRLMDMVLGYQLALEEARRCG